MDVIEGCDECSVPTILGPQQTCGSWLANESVSADDPSFSVEISGGIMVNPTYTQYRIERVREAAFLTPLGLCFANKWVLTRFRNHSACLHNIGKPVNVVMG